MLRRDSVDCLLPSISICSGTSGMRVMAVFKKASPVDGGGGGREGDSGVKQRIRQGAWLGENERGGRGRQHGQEREG